MAAAGGGSGISGGGGSGVALQEALATTLRDLAALKTILDARQPVADAAAAAAAVPSASGGGPTPQQRAVNMLLYVRVCLFVCTVGHLHARPTHAIPPIPPPHPPPPTHTHAQERHRGRPAHAG